MTRPQLAEAAQRRLSYANTSHGCASLNLELAHAPVSLLRLRQDCRVVARQGQGGKQEVVAVFGRVRVVRGRAGWPEGYFTEVAGIWIGDFERPEQLPLEEPEPFPE
jgi:hypothetical protein